MNAGVAALLGREFEGKYHLVADHRSPPVLALESRAKDV